MKFLYIITLTVLVSGCIRPMFAEKQCTLGCGSFTSFTLGPVNSVNVMPLKTINTGEDLTLPSVINDRPVKGL